MLTRHTCLLVAALAASVGTMAAQGTTAELSGGVQVVAIASNNFNSQTLAPGPITMPRSASATAACCLGMGGASITMTVAPLNRGASWTLTFHAQGFSADANLQLRASRGAEVSFRDC